MINYLVIGCFITFTACTIYGLIVLFKGLKKKANIFCSLMAISVALWSLGFGLMVSADNFASAFFFLKHIHYLGAIFISPCFLHFTLILLNLEKKHRFIIIFNYILAILLQIANFSGNLATVIPKSPFNYYTDPYLLYYVFTFMFFFNVIYAHYFLFKAYKHSTGNKKEQIKYLFVGLAFGFGGGSTAFPLVFNIQILPLGVPLVVIYVVLASYAILKYRLMDIKIVITRASIFLLVYMIVLGIPFWFGLATKLWIWALLIMGILATTGPFLYTHFHQQVEKVILNKELQYQKQLTTLGIRITQIKEYNQIFNDLANGAYKIISPVFIGFYTISEDGTGYISKQTLARGNCPLNERILKESSIIKALNKNKRQIPLELVNAADSNNIPNDIFIIPFLVQGVLHSFLILGPKSNSEVYKRTEMNIFEILSQQVSFAIEQCLFWEKEKKRLAKDEQARRVSTMDRFSASLSHEIGNPIFALQCTLERLFIGILEDMKDKLSPEERKNIEDMKDSIFNNVKRVLDLLNAVKEFNKPTQTVMSVLSIEEILKYSLPIINMQINSISATFQKKIDPDIYVLGDKTLFMEILMNLISNAIHAVKKNSTSNRKIWMNIYKKNAESFMIEVKDNGYGINKEHIDDIFLDFVTSKASTEGAGMGLSITRKIIDKLNGKIWAESDGEGKGATFFVHLPLSYDMVKNYLETK